MLFRIPMDRGGLSEARIAFDESANCPVCKKHGVMNAVAKIEKNGKTYLWYRCLRCRIGVGYDLNPKTNQPHLLEGKSPKFEPEEREGSRIEHPFLKELEDHGIPYTVVGSYVLKAAGYHISPSDLDLIVPLEQVKKAEELAQRYKETIEIYAGEVKKRFFTVNDFVHYVLSRHMFDDLYLQKLARHGVEDPRILDLFNDTEIIFVLESFAKEIQKSAGEEGK